MGWLRLVGSLNLKVSFAKEPYKRHHILQKETYNFNEPTNRSHPIHAHVQTYTHTNTHKHTNTEEHMHTRVYVAAGWISASTLGYVCVRVCIQELDMRAYRILTRIQLVYLYVCMDIWLLDTHTHTNIHIHQCTHTHEYTNTQTQKNKRTHTCIYGSWYTHTYKHTHTPMYTNTQKHTHMCVYAWQLIGYCRKKHTHTNIHTHKAAKLKYVAPKFKCLTTNSNKWIFVSLKHTANWILERAN